MYQSQPPRSKTPLPTMYDLPSEDQEEPGLPDEFHDFQPKLLRETCCPATEAAAEFFVGADLNLYYDGRHPRWYKRPDWFLVVGVPGATQQEDLRWSYVIWEEGVSPFLVVELLSPGTEDEDLGQKVREIGKPPLKWEVYERMLRVPFYVVFDRYTNHLRLFALERGRYQEVSLPEPRFWFDELGIGLGVWEGIYERAEGRWLRWYDANGAWLPTRLERAQVAEQQAIAEAERVQVAEQQAIAEAERAEVAEQQAIAEAERAQVAEQQAIAEAERAEAAEQQAIAEAERAQVAEQQAIAEAERAEAAEQQAIAEAERAQVAEQQIRSAVPQLAGLGLTTAQIAATLGLAIAEVERLLAGA
jgi:Uma2 family endonuclease